MLKVLILTIAFTSVICTGSYEVIEVDEYFSQ